MDKQLADKIKGVIFGQAVGDALGLGTEFMTKEQVGYYYPKGLYEYEQIIQDSHRTRWKKGEWTDDTDQMLCILDSLLFTKKVNSYNIANRIYNWAYDGGKGIGQTVFSVLTNPAFLSNPSGVAKDVWMDSNKSGAANGGVMRTAILGVWDYEKPQQVKINAEKVCKITHYDPRCVGSCVIVSLAVSELLKNKKDTESLINFLASEGDQYDSRIRAYVVPPKHSNFGVGPLGNLIYRDPSYPKMSPDISGLQLNDTPSIGYTLKAMGAGLWALQYAKSYEEGILRIIHEGGDADTNASVAGALLGAKFGFQHIPKRWVEGLLKAQVLEEKAERLIEIMS